MSGNELVRVDSTLGSLDEYMAGKETPSSPASSPLPAEVDPTEKFVDVEYPPGHSRSPTPPCEQSNVYRDEPALSFVDLQHSRGLTPLAAATDSPSQECEALPFSSGSATATDHLEELGPSGDLCAEKRTTENVTFTNDKMGALHRFPGRVLAAPETCFGSTAPELAHQLHEVIGDHVDSVVRDLFLRHGFDPDLS